MLRRFVASARLAGLLVLMLLLTACSGVINPPAPPTRPAPPPPRPTSTPAPTPTPEPERWVKNHRITPMWSAPEGAPAAVNFGDTSSTFCSFRIVEEADNARILVYNPYSDGTFWIDADAVGPVEDPPRRAGVKPAGVNCTEAIYDSSVVLPPGAAGTGTPLAELTRTATPTSTAASTGTATPTPTSPAAGTPTTTPTAAR